MPYHSLVELPSRVKDNLPKHTQEIYKESFNSAWEQYKDKSKRRGEESREEAAHKVAWNAVKGEYHKENGRWTRK